jgi:peptidoglycan/LPS O-acetylase OafA/YrhL
MKGKNIRYLTAVDQLRGLAAVLIILYHGLHIFAYQLRFDKPFGFDHWLHADNPLLAALIEGHTAVALFMVLSGFIFTHGATGADIRYAPFIYNRFLRIFPMFLFLYLVAVYLFPERYTLLGLVQGVLFQTNLPGATFIEPFTSLFWTIAVEFQFYLLFPFLIMFQRRYGQRYLLMLVLLFFVFRVIGLSLGANPRDYSYTSLLGRMDQFVFGMLLALRYQRPHPNPTLALGGLIVAGLALIGALAGFHYLGGYPIVAWYKILWPTLEGLLWAAFIYCYLVFFQQRVGVLLRLLARLGEVSYSLYLSHLIVIELIARNHVFVLGFGAAIIPNALLTTLVVVLPVAILLASLTYQLIERPFLELRRVYLDRTPEPPATEAPTQ